MTTVLERQDRPARARPRFARDLEAPELALPVGKRIGEVVAVSIASSGDIFVLHQPVRSEASSIDQDIWLSPVVHLKADGAFVREWGGPQSAPVIAGVSQWPSAVEGIQCDDEGNVWIFGSDADDNAVLKYSADGQILMRIGTRGKRGDDADRRHLSAATSCYHDTGNREVFISDGYGNHRIIAFNSDTGEFSRMWGGYGEDPSGASPDRGFSDKVHRVTRGPGGRIYVADRAKSCVQEFALVAGGAAFLREVFLARGTSVFGTGSAWDIGFSPDQRYMYVADGSNFRMWVVDVESFDVLGSTSLHSEHENDANEPLHTGLVHRFAVEPNGDVLLACVNRGLLRLKFVGVR